MAVKRWILQNMNRMNAVVGRPDLAPPRVEPTAKRASPSAPAHGGFDTRDGAALPPDQLGPYAPLVAALHDELSHFAGTQLRMHLAIAERDRYLLTSVDVECIDGSEGAALLERFTREFTPEQVKRFIARGIIAQLPNAAAIDLAQFGGLRVVRDDAADAGAYADLVAQLRASTPGDGPRSFEVRLAGRWSERESAPDVRLPPAPAAPHTPLAGTTLDCAIEDARGTRTVVLPAVLPHRRYAIGKGEGCDVPVAGAFVSRRHCEVWLDGDGWWVADTGSTNGIRVEQGGTVLGRSGGQVGSGDAGRPLRVAPGACIVLSALATGLPSDYPRIQLGRREAADLVTPLAVVAPPRSATPVTPIAAPHSRGARLSMTVAMQSGTHSVPLANDMLPLRVGRSRMQDLVVDWAHEGVSGRHVEIANCDDDGAEVEVLGDNGVTVGGVAHAAGERFRWNVGETMTLGRVFGTEPDCALTLVRAGDAGGGQGDGT
jgi:hypothetical protein